MIALQLLQRTDGDLQAARHRDRTGVEWLPHLDARIRACPRAWRRRRCACSRATTTAGWNSRAHAPAANVEEVHAYYRRAGALLCLSWIFGARDLHAENMIATSQGPVIVDAEMLMQPQGSQLFAPADAGSGTDTTTCLDTGLLSLIHRQADGTMIDIGGLRGAVNSSTLDGVTQPVEAFADDLRHGFAEAYRFAIDHMEPALDQFARCRTRVAFRSSEQYASLQRTLAQPRFQRHGALRSCVLDALNRMFSSAPTRPKVWTLVEEERRALERLDIPRFTSRAEGRSVTPGGSVGPIYASSGIDAARLRIERLSADDLDRQLLRIADVLEQSTSARFSTPPPSAVAGGLSGAHSPQPGPTPRGESAVGWRAAPRKPGEGVVPLPFEGRGQGEGSQDASPRGGGGGDDEGEVAGDTFRRHAEWIGRELLASIDRPPHRFRADPDGRALATHALYGGTLGRALFFAALSSTANGDGDARWADGARAALEPTRRWLHGVDAVSADAATDPMSIGITSGLGSIVYAGVVISKLLRDPALLDLSWQATALITRGRIADDARFDLADGAAGAIIALLGLAREAPERADALDDLLGACGDHLVVTQVGRQVGGAWPAHHGGVHIGFAHGAAGIAWALTALHARLGRDRYRQAAARARAFEESQFVEARGNWTVLETSGPEAPLVPTWMNAWCHGAPGILLARTLTGGAMANGALTGTDALHLAAGGPNAVSSHDDRSQIATPLRAMLPTADSLRPTAVHSNASRSHDGRSHIASPLRVMPPTADSSTDHLCCGAAGHAEILLTLGQLSGDVNAIATARTLGRRLIARARERGHFRLTASGAEYPIADPGFFQGLAGIGYHLLRLADPQALPAVLAFATTSARTTTSAGAISLEGTISSARTTSAAGRTASAITSHAAGTPRAAGTAHAADATTAAAATTSAEPAASRAPTATATGGVTRGHAPSVAFVPLQASMSTAVAHMTFPAYRHLLSLAPNVRHPQDGDTRRIQPIGVVAILDGRPVGLALAEVPLDREPPASPDAARPQHDAHNAAQPSAPPHSHAHANADATADVRISTEPQPHAGHAGRAPELLSLFTDASVRRRGVGVALVEAIEQAVAARHESRLEAVYMTGKADVTAIERIFARRGWHPPAMRTSTLRFTVDEAAADAVVWPRAAARPRFRGVSVARPARART